MSGLNASSPRSSSPVPSTSHSRSAPSPNLNQDANKLSDGDLEKRRKVAEALKLPLMDVNGKKKRIKDDGASFRTVDRSSVISDSNLDKLKNKIYEQMGMLRRKSL